MYIERTIQHRYIALIWFWGNSMVYKLLIITVNPTFCLITHLFGKVFAEQIGNRLYLLLSGIVPYDILLNYIVTT